MKRANGNKMNWTNIFTLIVVSILMGCGSNNSTQTVLAQIAGGNFDQDEVGPFNYFGRQQSMSAYGQQDNLEESLVDSPQLANTNNQHTIVRRQISYPQLDAQQQQQQQPQLLNQFFQPQPQQQPPQLQQQQQQPGGGVLKFFQDLGPQVERAKAISDLLSAGTSASGANNANNGTMSPMQLLGKLQSFVDITRTPSGQQSGAMLQSAQRSLDQAGQQTDSAVKQADGTARSALADIGDKLHKLATNNPNLMPDMKNLFQSISNQLSAPSSPSLPSSFLQPPQKSGPEQFAEQLAKAGQ